MNPETVNLEDLHLEESDFEELEYSEPISFIFIVICVLFYSFLIFFAIFWGLYPKLANESVVIYLIISLAYLILLTRKRVQDFIFKRRLKNSLNFYRKVKISFDSNLWEFTYDPHKPPNLLKNFFFFYAIFIIEILVVEWYTGLLDAWFPNPSDFQITFYYIGVVLLSLGFLTFVILQGIWNWNRYPNYFAESFYYLKAYIIGDKKDPVWVFACKSLNSFFKLLRVNEIPINFDESKLEDLSLVIEFFSPDSKAIGKNLEDKLWEIFFQLKEKHWLKTLLLIESIEKDLKEEKNKLGSIYLNREYIKDESSTKKWLNLFQKELILTIFKQLVVLLLPPAIYLFLQGF